jgi:hypothetical protein
MWNSFQKMEQGYEFTDEIAEVGKLLSRDVFLEMVNVIQS